MRPARTPTIRAVLVLATRGADFSFPSDHAVMAGAVAVGLVFVSRRLAALAAVAALAMAFARVYIAAHYPADVAVGLALGAAVAVAVYLAAHRLIASAVAATPKSVIRRSAASSRSAPMNAAETSSGSTPTTSATRCRQASQRDRRKVTRRTPPWSRTWAIPASGAPPGTTTADVPCPADRSDGRELLDVTEVGGTSRSPFHRRSKPASRRSATAPGRPAAGRAQGTEPPPGGERRGAEPLLRYARSGLGEPQRPDRVEVAGVDLQPGVGPGPVADVGGSELHQPLLRRDELEPARDVASARTTVTGVGTDPCAASLTASSATATAMSSSWASLGVSRTARPTTCRATIIRSR